MKYLSVFLLAGLSLAAQPPAKITDCSLYFSNEASELIKRDESGAIVSFKFQDDKIAFYEFYQKLREQKEQ